MEIKEIKDKKICRLDEDDCKLNDKFDLMFKQVNEMHVCIFGNGNPGLKTKQAIIEAKANLCLWVLGIFMIAMIGVTVKTNMDKEKTTAPIEVNVVK